MNRLQVCRQLRYIINNRKWEDDATNSLVTKAYITAGIPADKVRNIRMPAVLIAPETGTPDPEEPNLKTSKIRIRIVTRGAVGDTFGEKALIGGNRDATDGQGKSAGRGLLEVEEEVLAALKFLSTGTGISVNVLGDTIDSAAEIPEAGYYVAGEYTIEARHTVNRYYHPVEDLKAVDDTGGNTTLTWRLPPARFDRRNIVVRRAAGATAPATPSAGTGIVLGSDLAVTVTDNPGAGQFSYAVFAGYREHINEENEPPTSGDPDRYGDAENATVTVT